MQISQGGSRKLQTIRTYPRSPLARARRTRSFARGIASLHSSFVDCIQSLDAYKVALELARKVHQAKIRDAELRDQATRASKSAFLGLCEGLPSDASGIRRRHFDIANNSLHEMVGAVDLADAIGAIDTALAVEILGLASRLKRMLRALPR